MPHLSYRRLHKTLQNAEYVPFNANSKFIIMSDCHRGQGNTGDNFLLNQTLFFGAMQHYYNNGFTYIELGDGDELWENTDMTAILRAHSDAFGLMSRFHAEQRFYMLYGNHDIVKRHKDYLRRHFSSYYCDVTRCHLPVFPNLKVNEGLVLKNPFTGQKVFLLHGHQGSILNDFFWRFTRFCIRYFWYPLERIGLVAPTGGGVSHRSMIRAEQRLAEFASGEQLLLIAGHTHRPVFALPGETPYFNDGSCVHPRCITGIEIENEQISLVKWELGIREERTLYVKREPLEGPVPLSQYTSMPAAPAISC